jgi:hypothetical protein
VQQRRKVVRWLKVLRGNDGAEIAEFAVVLPVLLLFLFAIMWFGRAYNIYTTVTFAAREGAKVAVVGTGPSCATCNAATPTAADVYPRVQEVLAASHIDATQIQAYAPSPAPSAGACGGMTTTNSNGVTLYNNAQLNEATSNPPACGVVVSFQYPFKFFLLNAAPPFGTNKFNLQLKAAAQMQEEN